MYDINVLMSPQGKKEDALISLLLLAISGKSGLIFLQNYYPGKNVTIDKQLVGFRGRYPFKLYIPSKLAKYVIQIWTLYNSATSYVLNHKSILKKHIGNKQKK